MSDIKKHSSENPVIQLEKHLPSESLNLISMIGELAAEEKVGLYLVGGAVRDLLLGRANFDLDLVVEGDAPKLAILVAQKTRGKFLIHRRFGTAKLRSEGQIIDLATARSESYVRPGALPTVRPGSIKDDLKRRDFTINAMAIHLNPDSFGKLVDPFEGKKDLKSKLIRILHGKSFIDDATRMLRAIRYEQRFGFHLEKSTELLLCQNLSMLDTISGDRIRHELELILKEESPEKPLGRAGELGLLDKVHPSLKGDGWLEDKFQQARSIAHPTPPALYFALLAYPLSQGKAEDFVVRLKMPGLTARAIRDTLHLKSKLPSLAGPELPPSAVYRLLQDYSPTSILACAIASDSALVQQRLHLYLDNWRHVKTSLDGLALQHMGIPQGPQLGQMLRLLHEAKLDGRVNTREQEIEMVQLWLAQEI